MSVVTKIESLPLLPRLKRVGVYCRVSSTFAEQLASLANQVSHFVKMVPRQPGWLLEDIYIDISSGETSIDRSQFQRLLSDCRDGKIDTVITKSISRFGRDTMEMLKAIRELRAIGVEVLFEQEHLSTLDADSELAITLIEAFAQAENQARSQNTRWGIEKRAKDGTSGLYKRRCFGYCVDERGNLQINEVEAAVVRSIFEMYLSGESLVGIIRKLAADGVKTATSKDVWSKNSLDKLLSNEKYCGNVEIFKTYTVKEAEPTTVKKRKSNRGALERYVAIANHPAIISQEMFDAVQAEKSCRSNVDRSENGLSRKTTRYSVKRDAGRTE